MKLLSGELRLAATDVSNHLACRHLTQLELSVARGERKAPECARPASHSGTGAPARGALPQVPRQSRPRSHQPGHHRQRILHGRRHHRRDAARGSRDRPGRPAHRACWSGCPTSCFASTNRARCSKAGPNEAHDCKLARETKATTILRLSLYSELLGEIQGVEPEEMRVIAPGTTFSGQPYRVAEYAAYYRYVKRQLEQATANTAAMPDPRVAHPLRSLQRVGSSAPPRRLRHRTAQSTPIPSLAPTATSAAGSRDEPTPPCR